MSDEVMTATASATDTPVIDAPATDASPPADLGTAVFASEGLHDDPPPSTSVDVDPARADRPPASELTDPDAIERVRLRAIEEYRVEQEARARAEAEAERLRADWEREQHIARAAADGDLSAQEEIYQRGLRELQDRAERARLEERLAPERAKLADQVRRSVWEELAKGLGVDPNDRDLLSLPADAGLRGLAKAAIAKATDTELLDAVRTNPAVRKWIDGELATARDAAQARGMARALGSGRAPSADVSTPSATRQMSGAELERAAMSDPSNPDLYRAWVEQERRSGRYW